MYESLEVPSNMSKGSKERIIEDDNLETEVKIC